jgi:hypothetical protein
VTVQAGVSAAHDKARSTGRHHGITGDSAESSRLDATGKKACAIDQAAMIAIMRAFSDTTDFSYHAQKTCCR